MPPLAALATCRRQMRSVARMVRDLIRKKTTPLPVVRAMSDALSAPASSALHSDLFDVLSFSAIAGEHLQGARDPSSSFSVRE